ncbi:alpha/beta hydrolase [Bacillus sp. MUM 13]|uniref:alpha/beta fold hydrolase n=1 Tax=Bacillus sp. MUM 13 TaxID=1678001 RepID=UPI0008F5C8C0|nr:alpha/beta hydrolase [Bacillus sp. MUM 13]OIK06609.1 alpha/beta hydrolase [Bacillus sp. MUM 13]
MKKVYFLHGFMGTAESHFSKQVSSLEDCYELILLDLPGHGNAPVEASESYFECALNYVIAQIKDKGEGYIVGLSLGASLAIHIALKEPKLVNGIALTGYFPFIPDELKDEKKKQYEFFSNIEVNDPNTAELFRILHGDQWKRTLKYGNHTMTFHYPVATKEHIENIRVPMLILNGSNELLDVEAVTYVKKIKNDTEVGLVPNAGHLANIDQPGIYNKILKNFLENLS